MNTASLVMVFLNQMEYYSFRREFSLDWHLLKKLFFPVIALMYSNPTSSSFLGTMSKEYFAQILQPVHIFLIIII